MNMVDSSPATESGMETDDNLLVILEWTRRFFLQQDVQLRVLLLDAVCLCLCIIFQLKMQLINEVIMIFTFSPDS